MIRKLRDKLTYANIVGTIALFVALSGTAYAAISIPPNSVGSRQLKAKAVTGGKIADGAVSGGKIAEETITGANIKLSALGAVPQAANATNAANANTVGGHAASCPQGTVLIRGLCFDSSANGPVETPQEAADACAAKGGWLPSPLQLYATREQLNLGSGAGDENQFTDEIYANTTGVNYRSVVVDGTGVITEISAEGHTPEHYYCVYPLVR